MQSLRSSAFLLASIVWAALPCAGRADGQSYYLDLDTGGHRAVIRDVDVSADGAVIVSASDDKTVRVWDWQAGISTAVLRGQIGPGSEGLVNAVALSADGTHVAVAGYFGANLASDQAFGDVRIFDLRSGAVVNVLKGHQYVVEALAYDPVRDELSVSGQGGWCCAGARRFPMRPRRCRRWTPRRCGSRSWAMPGRG